MDQTEQQVIDGLFAKVRQAETGSPPRDEAAERRIQEHLGRQPAAPYYMAQAIVVQEQALEAAQARIQELEQAASRPAAGGGFLGSLFGAGGGAPVRRQPPTAGMQQLASYQQRGGSGFLAGAMQTAMGVAGGVLLGNMLMGAFSGGEAMAEEAPMEEPAPEEDLGMDEEF